MGVGNIIAGVVGGLTLFFIVIVFSGAFLGGWGYGITEISKACEEHRGVQDIQNPSISFGHPVKTSIVICRDGHIQKLGD